MARVRRSPSGFHPSSVLLLFLPPPPPRHPRPRAGAPRSSASSRCSPRSPCSGRCATSPTRRLSWSACSRGSVRTHCPSPGASLSSSARALRGGCAAQGPRASASRPRAPTGPPELERRCPGHLGRRGVPELDVDREVEVIEALAHASDRAEPRGAKPRGVGEVERPGAAADGLCMSVAVRRRKAAASARSGRSARRSVLRRAREWRGKT
ncbi:hypothetical protein BS78_07G047500 [Paspalum vaginatum]|nr:hypothetical protein BS78_07G047500 [Paspalum vaginatum]